MGEVYCRRERDDVMEHCSATLAVNEYLIKIAVDFWTAVAVPGLYYAKYL
jgi:hypothetical protein